MSAAPARPWVMFKAHEALHAKRGVPGFTMRSPYAWSYDMRQAHAARIIEPTPANRYQESAYVLFAAYAAPDGPAPYALAQYCEGDTFAWYYQTEAERDRAAVLLAGAL